MSRVLLTGGSGFIALHVLSTLLERGHSVVTTVRSQEKADKIKALHPNTSKSQLDFTIVPDIAVEGAFDQAVISDPPFEVIIHTASPFHYDVTDIQTQLLDPAIIGTTGILKSAKAAAPSVKRVIITSSFAAIIDGAKDPRPGYAYSEKDWNPVTHELALTTISHGYRGSKTFAERAAWDFIEKEKPNFDLVTMNPPLVFGPPIPSMQTIESLNTSNQRVYKAMQGEWRDEITPTTVYLWVDVLDLALAHVKALEVPAAGGQRFFITSGLFNHADLVEAIRKAAPELDGKLPPPGTKGGAYPEGGFYSFDNSRSREVLGIQYKSLEECIGPLVKTLQKMEA